VLAAVSGDSALIAATADEDLYTPVAERLGVERPIAKVAVLAAMYGQTSGAAGEALAGMEASYPTAMTYLREAERTGREGRSITTYGGRLVRTWATPDGLAEGDRRAVEAARGRFTRNAAVQGAAAELFKAWAATVRLELRDLGAAIVLCLHDELLVHADEAQAQAVVQALRRCLNDTARWWFGDQRTRFVAEIAVGARWTDTKPV
jgi:DNA polymerase-1